MIKQKYYLIVIGLLIAALTGGYFFTESQKNKILDQVKNDLQKEKELALTKAQQLIKERESKINELKTINEKAKADSRYWYNQAKKNSVNPVYDIDFITAAGIIAGSNYKPGSERNNVKQKEND